MYKPKFSATEIVEVIDFCFDYMTTSDAENYFFYISKNDTNAYNDIMSCVDKCGNIEIINNLFQEDASVNYKITFPKKANISEFIFTLISSSNEFFPKIMGVPVHDVVEVLYREREKNPYELPEHKIDEESTAAVMEYIKGKYLNISNEEIVNLLIKNYGIYAVAEKHDKYWMYFHGEKFREEMLPGAYYKSLSKSSLNIKWKSEWNLYRLVYCYYPNAKLHYTTTWLGEQHIDIFIPSLSVGIEYQGLQHYEENDFFGGEMGFCERRILDEEKKWKCRQNGVKLYEWPYYKKINCINFINFMNNIGIEIPIPNLTAEPKINFRNVVEKTKRYKSVCQFAINGKFIKKYECIDEAEQESGIPKKAIYKAIAGQNKTAGGFQWRYFDVLNDTNDISPVQVVNLGTSCSVYQISEFGEIIGEFESISQATKQTGINSKSISLVLKGVQKLAGGYFWKRKE